MRLLRRRTVALLLLSVFLFAGAARTIPAICCLFEAEHAQVAMDVCCPADEHGEEAPFPTPCDSRETCPKSCCVFAPSDEAQPAIARLVIEEVPGEIVSVVQDAPRPMPRPDLPSISRHPPPITAFKAPLHLRLQVLLC